jgi:hypothetical protein
MGNWSHLEVGECFARDAEPKTGGNRVGRWSHVNVRFGSKADMCGALADVRSYPESGHVQCKTLCPLSANSGYSMVQK